MEFFEKSRQEREFRNMVDDPRLLAWALHKPYKNCCGLAATGDEIVDEEAPAEEMEPVKNKVLNLQAWRYIRTALVIIGAIVVIKFIISKTQK